MNPYLIIRSGNDKMLSDVMDGTGNNPVWNTIFTSNANSIDEEVEIKIMNKDSSTAENMIGVLVRTIATLIKFPG